MTSILMTTQSTVRVNPGAYTASSGTVSTINGPGADGVAPYTRLTGTPVNYADSAPVAVTSGSSVLLGIYVRGVSTSRNISISFIWDVGPARVISSGASVASGSWTNFSIPSPIAVPDGATYGFFRVSQSSGAAGSIEISAATVSVSSPRNMSDYGVQEDGGNLDASKFDGGVPQITATIPDFDTSTKLMDDTVTITDDLRGTINGTVRGLSRSNGMLTITADHPIALLNTYRSVPPFPGTSFATYMTNLLAYLQIGLPLVIDASVSSDVFAYPGFTGNVLDQLKSLCSARGYVMAPTQTGLQIRAARMHTIDESSSLSSSDALNSQQSAQQIVVNYKRYSSYGTFTAYPPANTPASDLTPISVNAGETVVQTFQVNGTMSSAANPVPIDGLTAGLGQYCIVGNDGLPILAADWVRYGGSLTVRVLPDDSSVLEVTVRGAPGLSRYSPFRIATAADVSGSVYSALNVQATGYRTNPATITINTGAPANVTSEQVGITVDNPYIDTISDAYTRGLIVAAGYAGPTYTISDSAARLVNSSTTSPTLGTTVGNRLLRKDVGLIVTSVSTNASQVGYNATLDTTCDDFNTTWSGDTFNSYNTQWAGYTFTENAPIPLRSN